MNLYKLFFLLFFLFVPLVANALPRYAVQEGVNCYSCHVNPTGSGKRNDYGGRLFSQDLSLKSTRDLIPSDLKSRIAKYISFGTDIRVHNTTTLGTEKTNSFTVPQASLYAELNVGKHLLGYIDYDFANTRNRETFAMFKELPHHLYVKAGRINLPYGLRIDDDTSPIRSNFNMSYSSQDIGVEVGIMPGDFEFFAAISNGTPGGVSDENFAKAITTSANWVGKHGRVGLSFHWNKRETNKLLFGGINGGFKVWKFVFLGELDVQQAKSRIGGGTTYVVAGYGELNLRIIEGLYAKTVYDFLDPDFDVADNLEHRVGFGFDFYPLPYSQVSLFYRVNVAPGSAGDDQILAKLHFFF